MDRVLAACVSSLIITASALVPVVQAASQTRPVPFAQGARSATVQGSVQGYDSMDYTWRAAAGQTLTVSMKASHAGAFFNLLPPGSRDVALYNSSIGGNDYTGTLEQAGVYTLRVYLMRNEARRGVQADYTLTLTLHGAPSAGDARVAGTRFHATGQVACTLGTEAPTSCAFGVIRRGPGQARVHLTLPGGAERIVDFSGSQVTAPGAASVKATKQGDTWWVDVNDAERYRIPEAVILGG